jgi:hypothetical protein
LIRRISATWFFVSYDGSHDPLTPASAWKQAMRATVANLTLMARGRLEANPGVDYSNGGAALSAWVDRPSRQRRTSFEQTAPMKIPFDPSESSKAVVTVGRACGFVLEGERWPLVVTAAHCLPAFPPAASVSYAKERTYPALLSVLGEPPSIMTECLFVDPVADIAVLGPPDNQVWWDEAEAFQCFVAEVTPLAISDAPESSRAWLLSPDGQWFPSEAWQNGGSLWISHAALGILGGMSGSPILNDDGRAIGVVVASGGTPDATHTDGGPSPNLTQHLPGWLLRELFREGGPSRRFPHAR